MDNYQIVYLPLFKQDLIDTSSYITDILGNPDAANKLVNDVEKAIIERGYNPKAFQEYPSKRRRSIPYYAIYVRNYIVFYVIDDNVMEIRRFLYNKRSVKANL